MTPEEQAEAAVKMQKHRTRVDKVKELLEEIQRETPHMAFVYSIERGGGQFDTMRCGDDPAQIYMLEYMKVDILLPNVLANRQKNAPRVVPAGAIPPQEVIPKG